LLALRVFEEQAIIIFSVDHTRNKQNRILSATLNNNTQIQNGVIVSVFIQFRHMPLLYLVNHKKNCGIRYCQYV